MAVASSTIAIIGAVTALASTAVSTYASYTQAQAQQDAQAQQNNYQRALAEQQQKVANANAEIAIQEGKDSKKIAYEDSLKKRQEAAKIIGQQRAMQGASGAMVDVGSSLDLNLDTAEKGALDAFQIKEQGLYEDYNKRLEAWNYQTQSSNAGAKASQYTNRANSYSPLLSAGSTLIGGASKINSALGKFTR